MTMSDDPNLTNKPRTLSIPTDPASGKFIVADILPPRVPDIRVVASRTSGDVSRKKPEHLRTAPKPKSSVHSTHTQPKPSTTENESALDMWFRKEQTTRTKQETISASSKQSHPHSPVKLRFFLLFVSIFAILLASGVGASYFFSRVTIDVILKSSSYDFNKELTVMVTPTHEDTLAGELIELTDTATQTFTATGHNDVRAKAKGIISVYNAFNIQPQVLVANTRFEAPDGKIYRIKESVTVPGAVVENGSLSPRSVDATILAAEPGEEYNRDLTDFTIPGFKNSPRFKGFYARSKTPLEGGFIGKATTVTQNDIDQARESLEQALRTKISENITNAAPEGFLLPEGASEIAVTEDSITADAGDAKDSFSGIVTIAARALVFKVSDLDRLLAKIAGLDPQQVTLVNNNELTISVTRRTIEKGSMLIRVEGNGRFVWNLDAANLARELARNGKPKTFGDIFQQYEAIEQAQVRFSPSWIRSVPKNPESIIIQQNY